VSSASLSGGSTGEAALALNVVSHSGRSVTDHAPDAPCALVDGPGRTRTCFVVSVAPQGVSAASSQVRPAGSSTRLPPRRIPAGSSPALPVTSPTAKTSVAVVPEVISTLPPAPAVGDSMKSCRPS